MKHKHYDMIVAKAENVELVRFTKLAGDEGCEWVVQADAVQKSTQFSESSEYFLCLPQHKDAVLNALNGGASEVFGGSGNFARADAFTGSSWNSCSLLWYMNDACESRIKPKKEKRWIAYSTNQKRLGCLTFDSEVEARNYYIHEVDEPQFIEIEVKV